MLHTKQHSTALNTSQNFHISLTVTPGCVVQTQTCLLTSVLAEAAKLPVLCACIHNLKAEALHAQSQALIDCHSQT